MSWLGITRHQNSLETDKGRSWGNACWAFTPRTHVKSQMWWPLASYFLTPWTLRLCCFLEKPVSNCGMAQLITLLHWFALQGFAGLRKSWLVMASRKTVKTFSWYSSCFLPLLWTHADSEGPCDLFWAAATDSGLVFANWTKLSLLSHIWCFGQHYCYFDNKD